MKVADTAEQQPLNCCARQDGVIDKAPPARTCCGNVAYKVGKNTADIYLKQEGYEAPKAMNYFNNKAAEEKKNDDTNKKNNGGLFSRVGAPFKIMCIAG